MGDCYGVTRGPFFVYRKKIFLLNYLNKILADMKQDSVITEGRQPTVLHPTIRPEQFATHSFRTNVGPLHLPMRLPCLLDLSPTRLYCLNLCLRSWRMSPVCSAAEHILVRIFSVVIYTHLVYYSTSLIKTRKSPWLKSPYVITVHGRPRDFFYS